MLFLEFLACVALFFGLCLGLAWPLAARLNLEPAEKLVASSVLSLLGVYLLAFGIYLLHGPMAFFWILPALAAIGLFVDRRALAGLFRDPAARAMLIGQLLVTGWCTGWLFCVADYAGGGWASDWFEHWARARFFLDHWPLDVQFLTLYPLPARPPLANLVTGALLALTPGTFAHYQLFTTLLNSLAFLPAALLTRRFQPRPPEAGPAAASVAVAVLTVLAMLNPSFVENATFAWTKLITVSLILSGLYFFLRALDPAAPRAAGPLCALALAAAILAHYSAGPYVLLLAFAWPVLNRTRWRNPAFWRETGLLGLVGAAVLATWFGWSVAVYGVHTTLFSNSSVTVKDAHTGNQLLKIALNLRDTIVPNFLRPLDTSLIAQQSLWGHWQDWFFQLFQLNLFFMFGSLAWLVLIRELMRGWAAQRPGRWFWAAFIAGVIVLGVAVHGARDIWGLGHICLQALVVLGLVFLSARWAVLSRSWRRVIVAGAVLDFVLGVALHFAVESYALDRWLTPGRSRWEAAKSYSDSTLMNVVSKIQHQLRFFGDVFSPPGALVLVILAGILTLAVSRAARRTD